MSCWLLEALPVCQLWCGCCFQAAINHRRSSGSPDTAGELTLTGRVLPIGGVKEKTLAARRSGVSTIVFPAANRKDYDELSGAPS